MANMALCYNESSSVVHIPHNLFIGSLSLCKTKGCSSKFRSKHSSNTILCLLRNLLEQSL